MAAARMAQAGREKGANPKPELLMAELQSRAPTPRPVGWGWVEVICWHSAGSGIPLPRGALPRGLMRAVPT